ncbi:MAG: 5-(carboxyamino)imidazole ribonucleotide synthase [Phycisphaerales bacterium]|jgi:5-(carboxyamino)imidazole ribonucleotide synthase
MPEASPILAILGGGQLARMMAQAAEPMGVRCRVLDPSEHPSAARFAEHVRTDYDDPAGLAQLAQGAAAVTYEWENVPAESAERLAESVPVHPAPIALRTAQDRQHERELFARLGVPLPRTQTIDSLDELTSAFAVGFPTPCLLKARRMGYDGKGQFLLSSPGDAPAAWDAMGGDRIVAGGSGGGIAGGAVLDAFVDFVRELSIIACRGNDGSIEVYPLTQNTHRGGILRLSIAPAPNVEPHFERLAREHIAAIMSELEYVGVMALELFEVPGERGAPSTLVANEIAPRVHNSGHWTIEGAQTSQFANHVRAVLGLPLGSASVNPAAPVSAMVNAVGALPRPEAVNATPGAVLHDYEKTPRPGRKVGHTTITASTPEELRARLERFTRIVG